MQYMFHYDDLGCWSFFQIYVTVKPRMYLRKNLAVYLLEPAGRNLLFNNQKHKNRQEPV